MTIKTQPAASFLKGFTFVETMIVIALFSLLSVSLFSSLTMGFRVWKRTADFNLNYGKAIVGLERLSTELRRVRNYSEIGFFGNSSSVVFTNIYRDKIWNISYSYSPGEESVNRYIVSTQKIQEDESGMTRKLMSGVQSFNLSYYGYDNMSGNFTFFQDWNYTKSGVPRAVKVSLALKDGKIFDKVISIPISQ